MFVQSALLYTNGEGQRRIRCCTKRTAVTSSYTDLFASVNLSAMTALTAKQAVFKMLSKDMASARMFVQDSLLSALQSYCKENQLQSGLAQEADYPQSMRYWPLNTLGLLKCAAFADVNDVARWLHIDYRMALLTNLLHMSVANIELLVRPSMYRIDEILDLDADTLADEYYLPQESPLTVSAMSAEGIYLVDNGQTFVVRIGKDADAERTQTLIEKGTHATGGRLSLRGAEDNDFSAKLSDIVEYLQSTNYRFRCTQIGAASDKDMEFQTLYMVRDRTDSVMSYSEFFQFIAKQTRARGDHRQAR